MFEITETAVIGNHDLARGGSRRAEVLKDLRTNKRFAFVAVLKAAARVGDAVLFAH